MPRPSEEQILKNKQIIEQLIESFPAPRAEGILHMFEETNIGQEYFTAPASHKESYHACYPGGLAEHSLRVVQQLRKIAGALAPGRFDNKTLDFVGLFHDFGKVGDGVHPYYIPHDNEWHKKQGNLYKFDEECVYMPNAERGLYILQKHGIVMTSDEYLAIRLNDGMYDETNKRYAMHEPDLALLVHFADRWACSLEKA